MVKRIIDYPEITSLNTDDYIVMWRTAEGKQKKISATNLVFIPSKTTDANGWTVLNYGTFKEYMLSIPYNSVSIPGFSHSDVTVSPPVGRTLAQLRFFTTFYGNYPGDNSTGAGPSGSNLQIALGNVDSATLTFTGNVEVLAKER